MRTPPTPRQLDVVADLAYPLPVTVICGLLGVPREDEPVFREFTRRLTRGFDPAESLTEQELDELLSTRLQMRDYMINLVRERKDSVGDDLVSALLALARTEAQVALTMLARRLEHPRLVSDPPPYRDNAILRGPDRLSVAFARLTR
jgi:cytochrome P450